MQLPIFQLVLTPWSGWTDVLWRALDLTVHSTFSTSWPAITSEVVVFVYILFQQRRRHDSRKEWIRAIFDDWKQNVRDGLVAASFIFVVWLMYNVRVVLHEKPVFSYAQISEYSNSIVLAISNDSTRMKAGAIGSGFWVSESGYVVSCTHRFNESTAKPGNSLIVETLLPPSEVPGKGFTGGGIASAGGDFVAWDSKGTGILLLWVEKNPFHRDSRAFTAIEDTRSHQTAVAVERAAVPNISNEDPKIGDRIFVLGVENNNGMPSVRIMEGAVEEIGMDINSTARPVRLYTSVPFKDTFWGAPVLNESRQVVGVVGDSESKAVIVPSRYILEILNENNVSNR